MTASSDWGHHRTSSVPARLGDYLRAFQALVDRYGYKTSLFGHFGHGCVHSRITFRLSSNEGIAQWRAITREADELVVQYGGSLSGEHGDGQAKAEFLPIMFGPELMAAMERFKAIWDPYNRLNPGKVVHANRMDENLRAGPEYKIVTLQTKLALRSAEGDSMQWGGGALRRHGAMPHVEGQHHVHQLSRDPRGALLDARPLAAVLGDAAR